MPQVTKPISVKGWTVLGRYIHKDGGEAGLLVAEGLCPTEFCVGSLQLELLCSYGVAEM